MYTSLFRHIWKSQVLKEFFFKKNQKTFFFPAFPLQKGGLFNNYQQVINIHCTSPAGPYYNFTPYLKIVKDEREKNVIFIFHFFYFQHLHFSNVSKQHLLSASFFLTILFTFRLRVSKIISGNVVGMKEKYIICLAPL